MNSGDESALSPPPFCHHHSSDSSLSKLALSRGSLDNESDSTLDLDFEEEAEGQSPKLKYIFGRQVEQLLPDNQLLFDVRHVATKFLVPRELMRNGDVGALSTGEDSAKSGAEPNLPEEEEEDLLTTPRPPTRKNE